MISNIDKIFRQNVSEPLHSTLLPTVYEHTFLKQSQDFINSLNAVLTELTCDELCNYSFSYSVLFKVYCYICADGEAGLCLF